MRIRDRVEYWTAAADQLLVVLSVAGAAALVFLAVLLLWGD
jgi:hypothetical protein